MLPVKTTEGVASSRRKAWFNSRPMEAPAGAAAGLARIEGMGKRFSSSGSCGCGAAIGGARYRNHPHGMGHGMWLASSLAAPSMRESHARTSATTS